MAGTKGQSYNKIPLFGLTNRLLASVNCGVNHKIRFVGYTRLYVKQPVKKLLAIRITLIIIFKKKFKNPYIPSCFTYWNIIIFKKI